MRTVGVAALFVLALLAGGCSSTRITFTAPPGTVLFVNQTPHHLPESIELGRPGGSGESKRYDISLVFSTPQSREVRASGHLDLFGYSESDIDKLAVNTCDLRESELERLAQGTIVIFKGQSASRQPLYEMTLSTKKE